MSCPLDLVAESPSSPSWPPCLVQNSIHQTLVFPVNTDCRGLLIISLLRWKLLSGHRGPSVDSQLSQGEELAPVIVIVLGIDPKVCLHCAVGPFHCSICLVVVCGGQLSLNTQELAQLLPYSAHELCSPVRDDCSGYSVPSYIAVQDNPS